MPKKPILFALLAIFAVGMIAAGCGGDDETTVTIDEGAEITTPTDAEDAVDQAEEALDQAGEEANQALEDVDIDALIQECLDGVDNSGLPDDQKDSLRDLCTGSGENAAEALEGLGG